PGPGNLGLAYGSYTADKNGGPLYVTLVRTNGFLGPASATFTAFPQPGGQGAATPGADYTPTTFTPVWPSTWTAFWDFADSFVGPNSQASDGLTPHAIAPTDFGSADVTVNVINNPNSSGNLGLNVGLSQPQSSDIFSLGGENIAIGV